MGRLFLKTACLAIPLLSACTGVFFYPSAEYVVTPDKLGLRYETVEIPSAADLLHCWLLKARGEVKGTVVHLHGNAENISTHIQSVYWLPAEGYNVLLVDYRGYGKSTGKPSPASNREDVQAAIRYVLAGHDLAGPYFVFGQSLGGAAAIDAVARLPEKNRLAALIIESAFSGYRSIVRDKASVSWLLRPFGYPLSFLVSDATNPLKSIADLSPLPVLLVHGTADDVVPVEHSYRLYEAAQQPKSLWILEGGRHINAFAEPQGRGRLLAYLQHAAEPVSPGRAGASENRGDAK